MWTRFSTILIEIQQLTIMGMSKKTISIWRITNLDLEFGFGNIGAFGPNLRKNQQEFQHPSTFLKNHKTPKEIKTHVSQLNQTLTLYAPRAESPEQKIKNPVQNSHKQSKGTQIRCCCLEENDSEETKSTVKYNLY